VAELQRTLGELQPFTVVAFPDPLIAVREDRFENWTNHQPLSVGGLLGLERSAAADGDADGSGAKIEDGGTEAGERTADGNETADGDEIDGNETAVNETDDGLIDDNPLTDDDDGADDAAPPARDDRRAHHAELEPDRRRVPALRHVSPPCCTTDSCWSTTGR